MSDDEGSANRQQVSELKANAIRLSSRARSIRQGTDEALAAERLALAAWRTYLAAAKIDDSIHLDRPSP